MIVVALLASDARRKDCGTGKARAIKSVVADQRPQSPPRSERLCPRKFLHSVRELLGLVGGLLIPLAAAVMLLGLERIASVSRFQSRAVGVGKPVHIVTLML